MKTPIYFAYTSLVEVVTGAEPNVLIEELLCNKVFFPIHDEATAILGGVMLPDEPGTYQVWVNGHVDVTVTQTEEGPDTASKVEIGFSVVVPAPPECIKMLVAMAQEQRADAAPKIEIYNEGDAAAVTNLLEKRRVH